MKAYIKTSSKYEVNYSYVKYGLLQIEFVENELITESELLSRFLTKKGKELYEKDPDFFGEIVLLNPRNTFFLFGSRFEASADTE